MSQVQVPTFVLNRQLLSLKGDLWIDDIQGNHVFQVQGRYVSLRDVHTLVDANGTQYYTISKSLAHVHRTFEIKRVEQIVATVEQALLTFMGAIAEAASPGQAGDLVEDLIERFFARPEL